MRELFDRVISVVFSSTHHAHCMNIAELSLLDTKLMAIGDRAERQEYADGTQGLVDDVAAVHKSHAYDAPVS